MALKSVKAIRGIEETRLFPTVMRLSRLGDVKVDLNTSDMRFELSEGQTIRRVIPGDEKGVAKARKLMAACLGEGEVESEEIMGKYLEERGKYLLVFERGTRMLGASLGFYNSQNQSTQHIILTVDEKHRRKGIGGALSACHIIVAAKMAGTVKNLSYVTGELVLGNYLEVMAKIYREPNGRGNAFAAWFAYPLPPLAADWTSDPNPPVIGHILLMIPVGSKRSETQVPISEFKMVVRGNYDKLYSGRTPILDTEIEQQLGGSDHVLLVSLNDVQEREALRKVVEDWEEHKLWRSPNMTRSVLKLPPLAEDNV